MNYQSSKLFRALLIIPVPSVITPEVVKDSMTPKIFKISISLLGATILTTYEPIQSTIA